MRVVFPTDPLPVNLAQPRDVTAYQFARLVTDSLVGFDRRLTPIPRAARGWVWSDDHRTLTFSLRESVLWHDGLPLTSQDVVHTWRTAIDPRTGVPDRGFALVESVEAVDRLTVHVHYRRAFSPAVASWTVPLAPASDRGDETRPLGCGPWKFTRWDSGERVILDAFPGYYDGPPGAGRLELEVLRDYSTRFAALIAGRVDITNLSPEYYEKALADPDIQRRFRVLTYRIPFCWFIAWRMDGSNPFFGDRRVRLAMTLAIDRPGFIEKMSHGFGEVAVTSFHPDLWGGDPELKPWPFDPARARVLLAEAGWRPRAGDGVLVKNGAPFEFRLLYAQSGAETQRIAELVQANLRAVGVKAQLEPLAWAVLLDRRRTRDFTAVMLGQRTDADPDPYDLWHSAEAQSGFNAGLQDPEVDSWIEQARETFDRAERERLYRRVARRLHEEQPNTFFFYPNSALAISRELTGLEVSPLGPLAFWPGSHAWKWSEGRVRAPGE